jgi:hypothetical protein
MHCREFRKHHVAFVDDLLCASQMGEMRDHLARCSECAATDVRVKRSLMVVRSMPMIEPSEGFAARLEQRLREANAAPAVSPQRGLRVGRAVAAAAALILAAVVSQVWRREPAPTMAHAPVLAGVLVPESVISDAALIAAVPAGIPVWPAVFMVGQMPLHLGSAGFGDGDGGR